MPRFFFHVRDGDDLTNDLEGTDFPDLESARADARTAAREILAEQIDRQGKLSKQIFEICDEAGRLLATVPFRDAIELP
jgi:hypothetical protein